MPQMPQQPWVAPTWWRHWIPLGQALLTGAWISRLVRLVLCSGLFSAYPLPRLPLADGSRITHRCLGGNELRLTDVGREQHGPPACGVHGIFGTILPLESLGIRLRQEFS